MNVYEVLEHKRHQLVAKARYSVPSFSDCRDLQRMMRKIENKKPKHKKKEN